MAKARVTIPLTEDETAAQAAAEDLAKLNQAGGGDLFAAIDELRGSAGAAGVEMIVTRLEPAENKGHCCNLALTEFSLEKMRTHPLIGPGAYMVQIKGPKGFLPGGSKVHIAKPVEQPKAAGGDFMTYLEYIEKRDAERKAQSSEKMNAIALACIPVVGTVLTALLSRNNQSDIPALIAALKPAPGPTITDLTTALANIQTLSAPKGSPETALDSALKAMEAVRDLIDETGGKKGDSGWADIVRDLIKEAPGIVQPILQARAQSMAQAAATPAGSAAPPAARVAVQPIPAPAPATAAPNGVAPAAASSDGSQTTGDAQMFELAKPMIREKLKLILKWASEDRDPVSYAQLFCDEHIPANFAQFVPQPKALELLRHPTWFEVVTAPEWEPALAAHREWCEEFRIELIEIVSLPIENAHDAASVQTATDT